MAARASVFDFLELGRERARRPDGTPLVLVVLEELVALADRAADALEALLRLGVAAARDDRVADGLAGAGGGGAGFERLDLGGEHVDLLGEAGLLVAGLLERSEGARVLTLQTRQVLLTPVEQLGLRAEEARAADRLAVLVGRGGRRRYDLEPAAHGHEGRAFALDAHVEDAHLALHVVNHLGEVLRGDFATDHALGVRVDLGLRLGELRAKRDLGSE